MNLTKVKALAIAMLIGCYAAAQDNEIEFHIAKAKTPSLYPDTFRYVDWGRSYEFVIRGVDPSTVDSIRVSSGTVSRHDSIIHITLPIVYTAKHQDTALLVLSVYFDPDAHIDTSLIQRRYPMHTQLRPAPMTGPLDRLFGGLRIITKKGQIFPPVKKEHIISATHYIPRSKLNKISDVAWFKPYMGKDTLMYAVDSIHARLLIGHKYHRYAIQGAELTDEVKHTIATAKRDDDIWINLYYKDPLTQQEKKKNLFFKVSVLARRDS